MKAVILAGGYGTRLSEETKLKPKPMVEIGGKPILWHIMKIYSCYDINEFIICCGYKGHFIKKYFLNHFSCISNKTIYSNDHFIEINQKKSKTWFITLADTGKDTMTGGRLKCIKRYIKHDETFCFTYGDGLGNIDIKKLIRFHKKQNREATLTATQPPGRYGVLKLNKKNRVNSFKEKPDGDGSWINGGFFVLQPNVFSRIKSKKTSWEKEPLENLAKENQLTAFKHKGFWHPMDTLRDKNYLDKLWKRGKAPWKIWK